MERKKKTEAKEKDEEESGSEGKRRRGEEEEEVTRMKVPVWRPGKYENRSLNIAHNGFRE